jgi:RNA polymerase sigma factor (sigma-70 family)
LTLNLSGTGIRFISQEKFDGLLAWLHPDRERAAEEYERVRKELIKYFSSMQAWTVADSLADLTLDRVVQKVGTLPLYWENPADWKGLCSRLAQQFGQPSPNPGARVLELFQADVREAVCAAASTDDFSRLSKQDFLSALGEVLERRDFYQANYFAEVFIMGEALATLRRGVASLSDAEVRRLNLLLLEAAFPPDKLPYFKAVARYIYLEYAKSPASVTDNLEDLEIEKEQRRVKAAPDNSPEELERARERERLYECQERCLEKLSEEDRSIISMYYCAGQSGHIDIRMRLAEQLGMSRNTLRVRLHRIRISLRSCIEKCIEREVSV